MKLRGQIGASQIIILIDSGASHNFISPNFVQQLSLPTMSAPQFHVRLGDGHRSSTDGFFQALKFSIGEYMLLLISMYFR